MIPLFAPYCPGGFEALEPALALLLQGSWQGVRPVQGTAGHPFRLQWQGGLAPLENAHCALTFPQLPDVRYHFVLPAHQLLNLLVQVQQAGGNDLSESFWRWLILGEALSP